MISGLLQDIFEDNIPYFYGEERRVLAPLPLSSVAKQYHELLRSTRYSECDDRSRTIEITSNAVVVLSNALEEIILPDFLLLDAEIAPVVARWKSEGKIIKPYRPQSQTSAARTVEQMFPTVGALQGVPS